MAVAGDLGFSKGGNFRGEEGQDGLNASPGQTSIGQAVAKIW